MYTWYYLYDVAGSGSSRTYKLSSTDPAGSVTPITWTTASPVAFTRDFTLCRTLYEGTFTGGRMAKDHYGDYIRNCVWPVTAALTLFGAESGCATANANWESLISDLATGQSATMADPSDYFYSAHNTTRYHAS